MLVNNKKIANDKQIKKQENMIFQYKNIDGEVLWEIQKYYFDGIKKYKTVNKSFLEMTGERIERPVTLYNADKVVKATEEDVICVVFGEENANCLQKLFTDVNQRIIVTTSPYELCSWNKEMLKMVQDKRVVVVYPNFVKRKNKLKKLLKQLTKVAKSLRKIELSQIMDMDVNTDMYDFVECGGTADMITNAVENAKELIMDRHWVIVNEEEEFLDSLTYAKELIEHYHLHEDNDEIFWFDGCIYNSIKRSKDESELKRLIYRFDEVSVDLVRKSINKIVTDVIENLEHFEGEMDKNDFLVACRNGVINLKDMCIENYSHKYKISRMINASYNEEVKGPLFDEFISKILPDEKSQNLYFEILAQAITNLNYSKKAYFFKGGINSGKTTCLEVLDYLIPDRQQSAIKLDKTNTDDFGFYKIVSSTVNISGDDTSRKLKSTGTLKSIIGRDRLQVRGLYRDAITCRAKSTMIYTFNSMPQIDDFDGSLIRKIFVLEFPYSLPESEQKKQIVSNLEYDYIFTKLINVLVNFINNDFNHRDREYFDEIRAKYYKNVNSLTSFVENKCKLVPGVKTASSELWEAFQKFCENNDYEVFYTQKTFIPAIRDRYNLLSDKVGANRLSGILGISLL